MDMDIGAIPLAVTTDLLTGMEWNPAQLRDFFRLATDIKARADHYRGTLSGRFLALIFEKQSLRTRVTLAWRASAVPRYSSTTH
jgi:ornithine carbamoyltransferase